MQRKTKTTKGIKFKRKIKTGRYRQHVPTNTQTDKNGKRQRDMTMFPSFNDFYKIVI
jgi:hypothetical protein